MTNLSNHRSARVLHRLVLLLICWSASDRPLLAADYYLTLGGGYNPAGNQASLEANVVFFQQVLTGHHRGTHRHDVFFADGDDPAADLQVLADKPAKNDAPATDLLASLHRRRGQLDVTYRNHLVSDISGPLDPALIRTRLDTLSRRVRVGDRLIIYVTAHGSAGPGRDQFNTTIDCWNERKITAREFTDWLNKFPAEVPVVMIMAQCYCGGFAHTIFREFDESKGLAPHLRAGFFAQQHDLPAAGCRPDIEHDEEFSSYFWGALAGRSRNGIPIEGCDIDGDGSVSFAEAYAYAVVAGETIDIPLRTSEVLLRSYSRLTADKKEQPADASAMQQANENNCPQKADREKATAKDSPQTSREPPALATLSGALQSFVDRGRPASGRIVTQLAKTLNFTLQDDVSSVLKAYDELRGNGRPGGRGRRQGSGRRDLLREVAEKWPELADERRWIESPLLKPGNQEKLLAELQKLPSWAAYNERSQQFETAGREAEQRELRTVKFRRLINALETIVLEQNLPQVAAPEIVARYRQMLALEESTLASPK
jgi:hypothetical protein